MSDSNELRQSTIPRTLRASQVSSFCNTFCRKAEQLGPHDGKVLKGEAVGKNSVSISRIQELKLSMIE